ncbi:MAG: DUF1127 domain-containing protein [Geminicoccaceae bacterium]
MIATLNRPAATVAASGRQVAPWRRPLQFLRMVLRTLHDRRDLAQLSDHMLHDIGLTRADVERELAQPLWQPIDHAGLDAQRWRSARQTPPVTRPR